VSLNPRPAFEHLGQALKISRNQRRRLLDEQCLRGVDHVVRGQAVVEPAGMWTDNLGHRGGEGDDVMFDLRFDLENAVNTEVSARVDRLGGILRHDAGCGECFRGGNFHRQPGAEPVLVAPDASHLGACVAWDHGGFSCVWGNWGL